MEMTNEELVQWCTDNLSSKHKIIGPNWRRNNYEYLKNRWPEMWEELKNKTLVIKGKEFTFNEVEYKPLIINGIEYCSKHRSRSPFIQKMQEYAERQNKHTAESLVDFVIENNLTAGSKILLLIQRCFPGDYKTIMEKYSAGSDNQREIIYRFKHKLDKKPIINKIPLKFWTYEYGYINHALYQKIEALEKKNVKNILTSVFVKGDTSTNGYSDLKRFYPRILKGLNSRYNLNNIAECAYLYINQFDAPPKCLMCKKNKCDFNCFSCGYFQCCSIKCARELGSLRKLAENERGISGWKEYYRAVWQYTRVNYKKYYDIINPDNLIRGCGRGKYQLDHIIPIVVGYCEQIEPEIIGHYSNLQMLEHTKNASKGGKYNLDVLDANVKKITDKIKNDKTRVTK
jgi:hypothetical protein